MMLAHFKQMLLLCIGNVPCTPRTVDPATKQSQFVDRFLMVFPKLIEILCRALQHLFEIDVPLQLFGVLLFHHGEQCVLLCHQLMALSKVAWKGK